MSKKAQGLGDTVENIIKAVGVDKIAKKVLGEDCGCAKRKEVLNTLYDYNKKLRCMTKEQAADWLDFKSRSPQIIEDKDQIMIKSVYNTIFKTNVQPCIGCNPALWKTLIKRVDNVYQFYLEGIEKESKSNSNTNKSSNGKVIKKINNKKTGSTKAGNSGSDKRGSKSGNQ
jgi:hypothetical protein